MRKSDDRACYECLCNYFNQYAHAILDWKLVLPLLHTLLTAEISGVVDSSPATKNRFEERIGTCESILEKKVLDAIYQAGLSLPDSGQRIIAEGDEPIARPDFAYLKDGHSIVIFVDGPDHDKESQRRDDERKKGTSNH